MTVRSFKFQGPGKLRLEAIYEPQDNPQTVLLAHPHPLYGGTMSHPILHHLAKYYHHQGFSTFRFNFRGVGLSEGVHDQGRGEVDDLCAAVDYLQSERRTPILLVGYSFGALTGLLAAHRKALLAYIGIAIPTELPYIQAQTLAELPKIALPCSFVTGSEDPISSLTHLREVLKGEASWVKWHSLTGRDHFFQQPDSLEELVGVVGEQTCRYFSGERCEATGV